MRISHDIVEECDGCKKRFTRSLDDYSKLKVTQIIIHLHPSLRYELCDGCTNKLLEFCKRKE